MAWLYAPLYAVGYMTGVIPGIKGFIALFVGGTISPAGPLVGGLLLGVLEVAASRYLPSIYAQGIAFALLMLVLVLRPRGLLGGNLAMMTADSWSGRCAWRPVLLIVLPLFGNPYHVTIAVNLCITLILTLSLDLVVGKSGQFHLSHAAFFGGGAYVTAILAKLLGSARRGCACRPRSAVIGALAALVALPTTRLHGLHLAVATLAFSLFVEVVINEGGSVTGGGYGIQDIPPLRVMTCALAGKSFYLLAIAVAAGGRA